MVPHTNEDHAARRRRAALAMVNSLIAAVIGDVRWNGDRLELTAHDVAGEPITLELLPAARVDQGLFERAFRRATCLPLRTSNGKQLTGHDFEEVIDCLLGAADGEPPHEPPHETLTPRVRAWALAPERMVQWVPVGRVVGEPDVIAYHGKLGIRAESLTAWLLDKPDGQAPRHTETRGVINRLTAEGWAIDRANGYTSNGAATTKSYVFAPDDMNASVVRELTTCQTWENTKAGN